MDVASVDGDDGGSRIEIFVFQLAQCAAVDGVGVIRTEVFEFKAVCAAPATEP